MFCEEIRIEQPLSKYWLNIKDSFIFAAVFFFANMLIAILDLESQKSSFFFLFLLLLFSFFSSIKFVVSLKKLSFSDHF